MVRLFLLAIVVILEITNHKKMKTYNAFIVNRLFSSFFTLTLLFSLTTANASGNYCMPGNPGVEYASLVASASEKGVFINWVTVSELNNSHFEVERSTDMRSFKTVAMVLDGFAATGTNGKTYKYKESTSQLAKGKMVYYRLKQIDINNQVHYSTIMAVQMNTTVTVFPSQLETKADKNIAINEYTNNTELLSKQSISGMGISKMPVAASTTGIFYATAMLLGSEICFSTLSLV